MTIPPSIKLSKANQVCKLIKSLYGLKQASRKWYERLTSLLIAHHFYQANSDHSLNSFFINKMTSTSTLLLLYVDDIIIVGNSMTQFDHIKQVLHHTFKIKNIGILKYLIWSSSLQTWNHIMPKKIFPRSIFWCMIM